MALIDTILPDLLDGKSIVLNGYKRDTIRTQLSSKLTEWRRNFDPNVRYRINITPTGNIGEYVVSITKRSAQVLST